MYRMQREAQEKVKAAGFPVRRNFPLSQEKQAKAFVAEVAKATGIKMEICKGFSLYL
jgi:hypothetical protein